MWFHNRLGLLPWSSSFRPNPVVPWSSSFRPDPDVILLLITSTLYQSVHVCTILRHNHARLKTSNLIAPDQWVLVNITHIQELVYKAVSSLRWYYVNTAGSEENEIGTSLCVVGDCCMGFHRYYCRRHKPHHLCRHLCYRISP